MILFDTNIIIYSAQEEGAYLHDIFENEGGHYSVVTMVETLGFHKMDKRQEGYLKLIFQRLKPLPITDPIIFKAIELRQKRKMTLGDALIAATAVIHNCTLYTRNVKDFDWITDLQIHNPMDT